jgi:glycosyltransferase involved in cell wall biosynthesis
MGESVKEIISIGIVGINYFPEDAGIAPYTLGLAQYLESQGHNVNVLTAMPHYPRWVIPREYKKWKIVERTNSLTVERLLHFVPKKPSPILRLFSEITFGARTVFRSRLKQDIVFLVSPALVSSTMHLLALRLFSPKVKILVWVQDLYSLGLLELNGSKNLQFRIAKIIESWLLRHADAVITIHELLSETISKEFGVPSKNIRVIRNWTHIKPSEAFDRDAIRKQQGWKPHETVVLHTGNLGRKQGLENVVEAARLAERANLPIRFVLMGEGSELQQLEELGRAISALEFKSPVSKNEYFRLLSSADLLLVNEKKGVSGMAVPSKLTSYFASGVPVVGSTDSNGTTAYEINSAGAGVVVQAGNPEVLLEAVITLAGNSELCKEFGLRGVQYVNKTLSVDVMRKSFTALISDILSQK